MKKYRIEYERKGCTGPGICAFVDPLHFRMAEDGMADLIKGKLTDSEKEIYVLEVEADENLLEKMRMAAQGCPARIIRIFDAETNERIA